MTKEEIGEIYPDALIADGFDDAILGIGSRVGSETLVVYDADKIVEVLETRDRMTNEEAWEYFYYNIHGAYVGEHTPIYLFTEI